MRNSPPLSRMRCLARLMRWATVASGTSSARAISAVVRPPTARNVSATCETRVSDGWQQSSSSASVSSSSGTGGAPRGSSAAAVSSRRRRADSARQVSVRRRSATVTSQPRGLSGTPSRGHWTEAASSASCTASSHAPKSP